MSLCVTLYTLLQKVGGYFLEKDPEVPSEFYPAEDVWTLFSTCNIKYEPSHSLLQKCQTAQGVREVLSNLQAHGFILREERFGGYYLGHSREGRMHALKCIASYFAADSSLMTVCWGTDPDSSMASVLVSKRLVCEMFSDGNKHNTSKSSDEEDDGNDSATDYTFFIRSMDDSASLCLEGSQIRQCDPPENKELGMMSKMLWSRFLYDMAKQTITPADTTMSTDEDLEMAHESNKTMLKMLDNCCFSDSQVVGDEDCVQVGTDWTQVNWKSHANSAFMWLLVYAKCSQHLLHSVQYKVVENGCTINDDKNEEQGSSSSSLCAQTEHSMNRIFQWCSGEWHIKATPVT
jgi:hypothetical protein